MTADPTLVELSANELRHRIGTGEISPVELLQACIDRIEAVNPYVNAVTATCYDRARAEAQAAERAVRTGEPLGLLHGLPTGVKDLEATAGLLTTYGSPIYRENIPAQDNVLVARLRAAGAIVTGKTSISAPTAFAAPSAPIRSRRTSRCVWAMRWGACCAPAAPTASARWC